VIHIFINSTTSWAMHPIARATPRRIKLSFISNLYCNILQANKNTFNDSIIFQIISLCVIVVVGTKWVKISSCRFHRYGISTYNNTFSNTIPHSSQEEETYNIIAAVILADWSFNTLVSTTLVFYISS
jgi:hypothetical protein